MKIVFKIFFLAFLLNGCITIDNDLNKIVTNSTLRHHLKQIIAHEDSLLNVYPTYGLIKSYTITFSQEEQKCFVELIAYFNVYDSHAMDGYFIYQEKYISIYGTSTCGNNFINPKKLKHGLIPDLFDFDNHAFHEALNMHKEPPAPPPPGEPYYRKYYIASPKNFIKVADYDDLR
jgi:hypothetical protein